MRRCCFRALRHLPPPTTKAGWRPTNAAPNTTLDAKPITLDAKPGCCCRRFGIGVLRRTSHLFGRRFVAVRLVFRLTLHHVLHFSRGLLIRLGLRLSLEYRFSVRLGLLLNLMLGLLLPFLLRLLLRVRLSFRLRRLSLGRLRDVDRSCFSLGLGLSLGLSLGLGLGLGESFLCSLGHHLRLLLNRLLHSRLLPLRFGRLRLGFHRNGLVRTGFLRGGLLLGILGKHATEHNMGDNALDKDRPRPCGVQPVLAELLPESRHLERREMIAQLRRATDVQVELIEGRIVLLALGRRHAILHRLIIIC